MSNTVHQFSSAAKFASEGGSENGKIKTERPDDLTTSIIKE